MSFDPLALIRTKTQGPQAREIAFLEKFYSEAINSRALLADSLAVWDSHIGQFVGEASKDVHLEGYEQDHVFERDLLAALFSHYVNNIEGGIVPVAAMEAFVRIACSAGNVVWCPYDIKTAKQNVFASGKTGRLVLGSELMLYLTSNAAEFRRVVDWFSMYFPPDSNFQHFLNYIKSTPFYTGAWPLFDRERWWRL